MQLVTINLNEEAEYKRGVARPWRRNKFAILNIRKMAVSLKRLFVALLAMITLVSSSIVALLVKKRR